MAKSVEDMNENEREKARNKRLFKEMKFKEKVDYIWHYYRWHIGGTIAGVAFGVGLVTTMIEAQNAHVYATDIMLMGLVGIEDEYEDYLAQLQETQDVDIHIMQGNADTVDPEVVMANELLFMVNLSEKKGDIMFLYESKYESLVGQDDYFLPLTELDVFADNLDGYELVTYNDEVYGIRFSESPIEGTKFFEDLILCVNQYAKDLEDVNETLSYLLVD